MILWNTPYSVDIINSNMLGSMVEFLGIKVICINDTSIIGSMPVDSRTKQPFGLLHGGASVVLAETLGSLAGNLCLPEGSQAVGLEINANHIRSVKEGIVTGTVTNIHLGKKTQVWNINILDENRKLTCTSRITLAVIKDRNYKT